MKKVTIATTILLILVLIFSLGIFIGKKIVLNTKNNKPTYQKKEKVDIKKFNQNENIIFLGDSITEIYPIEEIYGTLPIVKSGISGYTTEDILENIEEMVYQYNPTKVFLLIGTNDYKDECDIDKMEQVLKNIEKIVQKIRQNRKNAKIYIESIYPVNRKMDKDMVADRENDIIIKTNDQLKKYCKENKLTYINLYNQLTDEDGNFNKKYTYDGLHPNTMGYGRITRILLPYIYDNYTI